MKSFASKLALAMFICGVACSCTHQGDGDAKNANRSNESLTGRVGEAFYSDPFPAEHGVDQSSNEYFVEYTVTNTGRNELVFDRVEQQWYAGEMAALTNSTTFLGESQVWRLPPGGSQTFVAETKGETNRVYEDAKGGPVKLSITVYHGGESVLGPFLCDLPKWEKLPRIDHQNSLMLEAMGAPLPEEAKTLAAQQRQKMAPLKFQQK
jgi:hypothetical protein